MFSIRRASQALCTAAVLALLGACASESSHSTTADASAARPAGQKCCDRCDTACTCTGKCDESCAGTKCCDQCGLGCTCGGTGACCKRT